MKIKFTWRAPIPDGEVPQHVAERLQAAINRAMAFDIHLGHGTVHTNDRYALIQIEYDSKGHRDRWWIHRRARYAIIAVAVRAKIKASTLELVESETLPNKKSLRKPHRNPNSAAPTRQQRLERWRQFRAANQ